MREQVRIHLFKEELQANWDKVAQKTHTFLEFYLQLAEKPELVQQLQSEAQRLGFAKNLIEFQNWLCSLRDSIGEHFQEAPETKESLYSHFSEETLAIKPLKLV